MREEPTTLPPELISDPLALPENRVWATPVTASG